MQTAGCVSKFILKGFKDTHRSIFGTHKTLQQILCTRVGTTKDEGSAWTLADGGQSALFNSGMSRLALKCGEKGTWTHFIYP